LDIHQFFSTIGDKLGKFIFPNQMLENILALKAAIILVTLSLLISSIALLILALSHHTSKKSLKPIKPDSSPPALPQ
jgi:uncharacterized phage infection (PIP) family protein YhgE